MCLFVYITYIGTLYIKGTVTRKHHFSSIFTSEASTSRSKKKDQNKQIMSEKPILYYLNGSPPVRSVFLVARALNIELDRRYLDLFKGEHMTPEFLKVYIYRNRIFPCVTEFY